MIEEPFSILPIDKIASRLRADIEEMIENNQSGPSSEWDPGLALCNQNCLVPFLSHWPNPPTLPPNVTKRCQLELPAKGQGRAAVVANLPSLDTNM